MLHPHQKANRARPALDAWLRWCGFKITGNFDISLKVRNGVVVHLEKTERDVSGAFLQGAGADTTGQRIKTARRHMRITQAQIVAGTPISVETLRLIERDHVEAQPHVLAVIARKLGLEPAILEGE